MIRASKNLSGPDLRRRLFKLALAGTKNSNFYFTEGRNIKTIEWKENGAGQYQTRVP
jgi:hypothetical protein